MTAIPFWQVDAFTSVPFAGNPAAVCLLPKPAEAAWMLNVAAEMNLSETAFVAPGEGAFGLRWFTPKVEVALCGHATLATAHVLWRNGLTEGQQPLRFDTLSGELTATQVGDAIELDFPATPAKQARLPEELTDALGIVAENVEFFGQNGEDVLVVLTEEKIVRQMQPDFAALKACSERGVIVTAAAQHGEWDIVSRFFGPAVGIDEDPVTGSAHCRLGPYWANRLGRAELRAYQASERGGELRLCVEGDRVKLRGLAVTILEGKLLT